MRTPVGRRLMLNTSRNSHTVLSSSRPDVPAHVKSVYPRGTFVRSRRSCPRVSRKTVRDACASYSFGFRGAAKHLPSDREFRLASRKPSQPVEAPSRVAGYSRVLSAAPVRQLAVSLIKNARDGGWTDTSVINPPTRQCWNLPLREILDRCCRLP